MTALNSAKTKDFVDALAIDYPHFSFKTGHQDHWSPRTKTIFYNPNRPLVELKCSLLHELAHGILNHKDYSTDFELLKLEAEAWELASKIGKKYNVDISDDHIQDCLDTYRDWLHHRSACPACGMHVLQKNAISYKCFNCHTEWTVTNERFVRAYRRSFNKKKPA